MDGGEQGAAWPLRAWLLALVGALAGLGVYWIVDDAPSLGREGGAARWTLATFILVAAMTFAFVLERLRASWAIGFALVAGLVAAGAAHWSQGPGGSSDGPPWPLVSAGLAIAIAAPLFQLVRDRGGWRSDYPAVHDAAWTNVVLWCAAWAFVGIVWLLAFLLAALFRLIGIELIEDLLENGWFAVPMTGAAFGAAIGLLRERAAIAGALRRVVTAILGVLAPVLAIGLVIFLAALPFTGLEPLWQATKATTPILLGCIIGALILANAVIGDSDEDEARLPPLRLGAMALAAVLLPLALIAAISTGLRVDQHGLSPDRLWAIVFVAIATAFGLAYLVALLRGRMAWAGHARAANLKLAIGLCALAILLSTPLAGFNAIATRDQVARLASGRITAERFDWAALRFDFGAAGRRALDRLKASADPAIRAKAAQALAATDRWTLAEKERLVDARAGFADRAVIFPAGAELPADLVEAITRQSLCGAGSDRERCVVRYEAAAGRAVLVRLTESCRDCQPMVTPLRRLASGSWGQENDVPLVSAGAPAKEAALRGEIEIRRVERSQVFIGGQPTGQPFP